MSTKDDILRLAGRELQAKGVHSLSFRELAAALGIKSSSIHYHFPQKDDLIETLMQGYSEAVSAGLAQIAASTEAGRPRLIALVDMIGKSLQQRQCTAGVLAAESAQISKAAKKSVAEFFAKLAGWIRTELKATGKSDRDAEILSTVILTAIEGSLMIDSFGKKSDNLDRLRQYLEFV
jgi:TetR/AcrR family transcriptional repressor of nem operon